MSSDWRFGAAWLKNRQAKLNQWNREKERRGMIAPFFYYLFVHEMKKWKGANEEDSLLFESFVRRRKK
jgi:hypothetical protein